MNILNLHLVPNIACEEENESKPFIITKRKNVEASIVANCVFLGLNGGYWDAIGVRGAVRDTIQKQESQEKENAVAEREVKQKGSEKKRSLSKEEPTRKRHRTVSVGKQDTEPVKSSGPRNKKSPTPPRRLASLDSAAVASTVRAEKVSLRPSRSLEALVTETWVQESSNPMLNHVDFIRDMLNELVSALSLDLPALNPANKRPPTEVTPNTKRQRVSSEDALSDIDPICEDFEAYPVHFDNEFTPLEPEVPQKGDDNAVFDSKVTPPPQKIVTRRKSRDPRKIVVNENSSQSTNALTELKENCVNERVSVNSSDMDLLKSEEIVLPQKSSRRKKSREPENQISSEIETTESKLEHAQMKINTEGKSIERQLVVNVNPSRNTKTENETEVKQNLIDLDIERTHIKEKKKNRLSRKTQKTNWMTHQKKDQGDMLNDDKPKKELNSDIFDFEEEQEIEVDPPLGKILELVVESDLVDKHDQFEKDIKGSIEDEIKEQIKDVTKEMLEEVFQDISKPSVEDYSGNGSDREENIKGSIECELKNPTRDDIKEMLEDDLKDKDKHSVEKDSGNGSDRDYDDTVIEDGDLEETDYLDLSKDSEGANSDIWNSINETLMDLSSKTTTTTEDDVNKGELCTESKDMTHSSTNVSKKADFEWANGLEELKDEFADDNTDIWASTNEMMNEIGMSLDVSPLQPKTEQRSLDVSPSRKSRPKRKRAEETQGNPDSGKENADGDSIDSEIASDSRKIERVLSPANKRKKDFKIKPLRSSRDTSCDISPPSSPSSSTSKRRRTPSGSTDDGYKESKVPDSSTKLLVGSERLTPTSCKPVQMIEPIPLVFPPQSANNDKTSGKSKASKKNIDVAQQKKEKSKSDKKKKPEETKSEGKIKSSKTSQNPKSKHDWSMKTQTKTHPSSSLVKYYDDEYVKLKSKPEAKKPRRPSK